MKVDHERASFVYPPWVCDHWFSLCGKHDDLETQISGSIDPAMKLSGSDTWAKEALSVEVT
jgi:hypothetical protein